MSYLKQFANHCIEKGGLTQEEFDLFQHEIKPKIVRKGEVILWAGQSSNQVFFINKGILRAFVIDEMGKEHVVQFAPPGWFITDLQQFEVYEPSKLCIDAIENSEIIFFPDDLFLRMATISQAFCAFHRRMLHRRIQMQQQRIIRFLSARAEERYINFIKYYPDIVQQVPQWMIATYLGITPESLSRVRKELANRRESQS